LKLKKNKKTNLEVYTRLIIFVVFTIYWINSGYDLVKESGVFSDFIKNYNGNEKSIFTWENFVIAYLFFAVLCYPILIVRFLSFTLLDSKAFKELLTKKSFLYFLISPFAFIGFILFFLILRIGITGVIWILFFGYPIYLILKWMYKKINNSQ
jgi:hypothetical protein